MSQSVPELLHSREASIQALQQDYKMVFGSDAGKRVLDHIRGQCFTSESTVRVGESKPLDLSGMAVKEGRRQVALMIEQQLTWSLATLLQKPTKAVLEKKEQG